MVMILVSENIENLYIPQREKAFFFYEKHIKNYGQFLQTYWTATGNILGFVNMTWTIVYKVRRVHVAPYGPTRTCVHIIGE